MPLGNALWAIEPAVSLSYVDTETSRFGSVRCWSNGSSVHHRLRISWSATAWRSDLAPGYWLPDAYWGGVPDPLQILLAISLNVSFYALVAFAAMTFRAKWHLAP